MRTDLSLFNQESPYESIVNFAEQWTLLSNPQTREFWSAAQAFFEKMAYEKQTVPISPLEIDRIVEIDLNRLLEHWQTAENVKISPRLLVNIYRVADCKLPLKRMGSAVYLIEVEDDTKASGHRRSGWIRDQFVSEKMREHLDETRGVIRIKAASPTTLWALARFQEILLEDNKDGLKIDIPFDCLAVLLKFTKEWKLETLHANVNSVLTTLHFQPSYRGSRFFEVTHSLNEDNSPYFNPDQPLKSIRKFVKHGDILTQETQLQFLGAISDFFSRTAFQKRHIGHNDEGYSHFIKNDLPFLRQITLSIQRNARQRLMISIQRVFSESREHILESQVKWLNGFKPNLRDGELELLFLDETLDLELGYGGYNLQQNFLREQSSKNLVFCLKNSCDLFRKLVLEEISGRLKVGTKEVQTELSDALMAFLSILEESMNLDKKLTLFLKPTLDRLTEQETETLFEFNLQSQYRIYTDTFDFPLKVTIDVSLAGSPHKEAVLYSYWCKQDDHHKRQLMRYCLLEMKPLFGKYFKPFQIETLFDSQPEGSRELFFLCQLFCDYHDIDLNDNNDLKEYYKAFYRFLVSEDFKDYFPLPEILDSMILKFEERMPEFVAECQVEDIVERNPAAFPDSADLLSIKSCLAAILIPSGLVDEKKKQYRQCGANHHLMLLHKPSRFKLQMVVDFLSSREFQFWKTETGSRVDHLARFKRLCPEPSLDQPEQLKREYDICQRFDERLKIFDTQSNRHDYPHPCITFLRKYMRDPTLNEFKDLDRLLEGLYFYTSNPLYSSKIESFHCILKSEAAKDFFNLSPELQRIHAILLRHFQLRVNLTKLFASYEIHRLIQTHFEWHGEVDKSLLQLVLWKLLCLSMDEYRNIRFKAHEDLHRFLMPYKKTELIELLVFIQDCDLKALLYEGSDVKEIPRLERCIDEKDLLGNEVAAKNQMQTLGLSKRSQTFFFKSLFYNGRIAITNDPKLIEDQKRLPDRDKFINFLKNRNKYFTDKRMLDNCEKLLNFLQPPSWFANFLPQWN